MKSVITLKALKKELKKPLKSLKEELKRSLKSLKEEVKKSLKARKEEVKKAPKGKKTLLMLKKLKKIQDVWTRCIHLRKTRVGFPTN